MTRPLSLLLLPFLAPQCHGFSQPPMSRPQTTSPSRTIYHHMTSLHSTPPQGYISPPSPLEKCDETSAIRKIIDLDMSDNIDDVRRARSLARRDRLARWRDVAVRKEDEVRDSQDNTFLMAAYLPALLAYVSWEDVSHGLSWFLESYGAVKSADANQFRNTLLTPTITGVVVPVIAIALASLISTTVNVLRERQVNLRAYVNKEACELRLLRRAAFGMFGTRQHAGRRARALALMCGYVEQLITECHVGAVEGLEEMQLSGGISANELDRFAAMLHGVDGAAASRQGSVSMADDLIVSLNGHRSERVALLLSGFPVVHWGVLFVLCLNICIAYLLTSNQQVLQYLNSIQLRFLFGTIVGICSGTAALCWDLSDPFRGTFSIEGASTQLSDLRICLREDVRDALTENGEMSSSSRNFFRSMLGGPSISGEDQLSRHSGEDANNKDINPSSRYGLLSTVYFHLLTGPLGSNVRVIGDVVAVVGDPIGTKGAINSFLATVAMAEKGHIFTR
eukprot:CAMPEP_0172310474 /NCGR_PEP_ID=MMETSP1058-20130122/11501_1 /TAXON_ID=83371 /ORGANISM="Detonula confervacea, Strain CCMP 353" /LENGTH=507 /DNA_ID=CAMNT_0013023281 /DNA_START=164 /DNA_END=1686 /DNA_ORIENTATION=-